MKLKGDAGARPQGLVCHQQDMSLCSDSRGKPSMGLRKE